MSVRKETITQEVTIHVCDNCGAEYKGKNADLKLHTDYVTGGDICDKCQQFVRLVDRDMYYDKHIKTFGEVYTKEVEVNKDLVKATELDLDLDREDYLHKVVFARHLLMDLLDKIDKEYLKGHIRDFYVKNFIKTYFGL